MAGIGQTRARSWPSYAHHAARRQLTEVEGLLAGARTKARHQRPAIKIRLKATEAK